MIKLVARILMLLMVFVACKTENKEGEKVEGTTKPIVVMDTLKTIPVSNKEEVKLLTPVADSTFVRLADYSTHFEYDLRYATENNFLKAQVYECAECYLRAKTAKALIAVNKEFIKKGVKIKFFDCYRPNSVQYKMWEIVSDPQYVANPVKGSVHNRGGAVDITLVNLKGEELAMGTDFDFFGWKAYHDNYSLPKKVLENRKLLKETMEQYGFNSIRSEWWHYNLQGAHQYKVANFNWDCQ